MPLATATVTFNLADWVGTNLDHRRTRGWITTNAPEGYVSDKDAGRIRVDDVPVLVAADGTGSVTVWVPGAAGNPATWQTTFWFDVPRNGRRDRKIVKMGPFTVTASANLTALIQEQVAAPTLVAADHAAAAQTARTGAETARDGAVTARTGAETARTGAETARTGAETARTDAQTAATAARDISNISTSDDVVSALVAGTAGAGPKTRDELGKSHYRLTEKTNAVTVNGAVTLPDVATATRHRLAMVGQHVDTPTGAATTTATTGGALVAQIATPVNAAFTTATTGGTLAAGTYSYRVSATNALGETLASTATTIATTGTTSTVTVNWGAVAGATGYRVYGRVGGSERLIASVGNVTTYTDTGSIAPSGVLPTANTTGTYLYRVSAINANGETLASAAVARTIAGSLAAPTLAAPTTATTGGTLAAATYFYKITAINAIGETVGSNEVSQVTTGATSTVGLSWAAITGATGYKVYRSTTTGGTSTSPALVASVGAVTSYTDTGTAVSAGAVPASNTTSTNTNTISISWNAMPRATAYRVYGRTGTLLRIVEQAGTSYTDTGAVTPAGALPTANTTVAAANVTLPAAVAGKSMTVLVQQDAVGKRPPTFVAAGTDTISWRPDGVPSWPLGANGAAEVTLRSFATGAWVGQSVSNLTATFVPTTEHTDLGRVNTLPPGLKQWSLLRKILYGGSSAPTWRTQYTGIGYDVAFDYETGRYALVYGGSDVATETMKLGIAYSDDGLHWDDYGSNPIFAPNATAGQFDSGGVTFPQFVRHDGQWLMFYIGFPLPGFEQGEPAVGLATATSLLGPWTRQGAVLTTAAFPVIDNINVIYRPCVLLVAGTWYMFINAGQGPGDEHNWYATAPAPEGPWTVQTKVVPGEDITPLNGVSDPEVVRYGHVFLMLTWAAEGLYILTTDEETFPLGWKSITAKGTPVFGDVFPHSSVKRTVWFETPYGPRLLINNIDGTTIDLYAPRPRAVGGTIPDRLAAIELAMGITPPLEPAVVDTFTRVNGVMGNAETGQAWTSGGGTGWNIVDRRAVWSGLSDGVIVANSGLYTNYAIQFTISVVDAVNYPLGIVARGSSATTYAKLYRNGGDWTLSDGFTTVSVTDSPGLRAGEKLRLTVIGTTYRLYRDGVLKATWTGFTPYSTTDDTFQGLAGSGGVGLTVDNFSVTPI